MPKKITDEMMAKIDVLFCGVADLPEQEFNDAVGAIASIALGTILQKQGAGYCKGFLHCALASPPPFGVKRNEVVKH